MKKIDLSILIEQLIEESGLSAADLKQVESYVSKTAPKILIQPKVKTDWTNKSASHFGGLPSLPSEEFWPVDDQGSAGIFLCQINCAEVHTAAPELFPEKGMLFFFSWSGISEGESDLSRYSPVLYLDIPPETPPLNALPKNYQGGNLLSDTWFYSSHASLRLPESKDRLSESILPRFDMEFWYQDDLPCSYQYAQRNNISDETTDFLHSFKEKVVSAETNQVRPIRANARYCFLSPQTILHHECPPREGVNYIWVDNQTYPWCGLNITMFMQCLLSDLHTECARASKKLELLWQEFGLLDDFHKSYDPQQFMVKRTHRPILVKNSKLRKMEDWLRANHPQLTEFFIKLLCYENVAIEANDWNSSYIDKPYIEPDQLEKNCFNQWVAEWLNAFLLSSLQSKGADYFKKTLVQGQVLDEKPVRDLPEEVLGLVKSKMKLSIRHALRLSALDSVALLASHSHEAANRLPESAYSWVHAECSLGWPHYHYMCGHPQALQTADSENSEYVSLLTITHDARLMQACGGGTVLQFWIKPDDLNNKVFDKVIPSSECT